MPILGLFLLFSEFGFSKEERKGKASHFLVGNLTCPSPELLHESILKAVMNKNKINYSVNCKLKMAKNMGGSRHKS